jgi:N-acetyl-gamma-glutamyl-phosphate reductase
MAQAPELLKAGVKVIDLAADFRIKDKAVFEKWYKIDHTCPELLEEAAYGLAELNRDNIKNARLVANPGCYPTTMQLGYYPLKAGVIDAGGLIADCKSGVSGAGRKAEIGTLFSEASTTSRPTAWPATATPGNFGPAAEVHCRQGRPDLHAAPGADDPRHALDPVCALTKDISNEDLQKLFEDQYKDSAFVDVMPFGSHPETRSTRGSNMLRLALHRPDNGNTVIVLVVQDNLVKGASGQACSA